MVSLPGEVKNVSDIATLDLVASVISKPVMDFLRRSEEVGNKRECNVLVSNCPG